MQLKVTTKAMEWFREHMDARDGDTIRFFVRLGGCGSTQSGFSLGVHIEEPRHPELTLEQDGLHFYMEKEDIWYLDQQSLVVDVDASWGELSFSITG